MCEIVFADDEGEECVAVVVWSNRSLLNNVYFRETVWDVEIARRYRYICQRSNIQRICFDARMCGMFGR
jgi:hypothetical protein